MIKFIIITLLLFYFSDKTIKKNLYKIEDFNTGLSKNFIIKFNMFFWIAFLICSILLFLEKFTIFYGVFLLIILISVFMIFKMKDEYNNIIYNFYFWLFYSISSLVFLSIILTSYYVYSTFNIKRHQGPKGYDGDRGTPGKDSSGGNDIQVCHQQMILESTNIYNDYVERYNLEKPELMDQINNVYLKDNFKRICMSDEFKKSKNEKGVVKTIFDLKDKVRKWTQHILEYKRGKFFLEDYTSNDYTWNDELLFKSPQLTETESPFVLINKFPEWNWGNCHKKKYISVK